MLKETFDSLKRTYGSLKTIAEDLRDGSLPKGSFSLNRCIGLALEDIAREFNNLKTVASFVLEHNEKIQRLDERIHSQDDRMSNVEANVQIIHSNALQRSDRIGAIDRRLHMVETMPDENHDTVDGLVRRVSELQTKIQNLEYQREELEKSLTAVNDRQGAMDRTQAEHERRLENTRGVKERIKQTDNFICETIKPALKRHSDNIAELEEWRGEQREGFFSVHQRLDTLQNRVMNLTSKDRINEPVTRQEYIVDSRYYWFGQTKSVHCSDCGRVIFDTDAVLSGPGALANVLVAHEENQHRGLSNG